MGVNVQAQTSVSTTPVGFVSTELPASGFTYLGVSLTIPPALTSSTTTLEDDAVDVGIDLTALDVNKAYAMEIADGTHEGYTADIDSWTGQIITLTEDIEAGGIDPIDFDGSRVCIRELPTIDSIFGADNSAGLKAGTLATADTIYLYGAGGFTRHYYFPGGFGLDPGWRDEDGDYSGSTILHFGDGLVINTSDTETKEIVISGSVKLGPTNVPLYEGFNLVSNPSPVEGRLTLANSGIKEGLKVGTAATADVVYIPSSSGGFDKYYYFPGGFGLDPGWRNVDTGVYSNDTPLPDAGSFFIDRQSGPSSVMIAEDLPN